MKLKINQASILRNIRKADELAGRPVSIMLKSFYEYMLPHADTLGTERAIFSKNIPDTICYSIGEVKEYHRGSVVANFNDVRWCRKYGIKDLYIPINAQDDREGLSVDQAIMFVQELKEQKLDARLHCMITSGCINDKSPSPHEIIDLWENTLSHYFSELSLGGSYYLQFVENLPNCIFDIRIGEYMLFGTIPYCNDPSLFGDNALTIELEVIGIHRDRGHIVVRGGYSHLDTKDCYLLSGGLQYIDSSSEYTIYADPFKRYNIGDTIELVPNYKSLVKLQYVPREFT